MTSDQIENFLIFLRDCVQRHHMAEADEQETNSVTQDILHSLELEEHDQAELLALAEELAETRKSRRKAKDIMVETAPVLVWAEGNSAVIKSLERLLGDVRKAERRNEGRIYTPRRKSGWSSTATPAWSLLPRTCRSS